MSVSSGSSKRGLLRPSHSNRIPIFVVIIIILLASLFIYNLYSSSLARNELQDAIDNLRGKMQTCFKDKLEAEERLESVANTCKHKSSKNDEKLKEMQSSNKLIRQELENLRAQSDKLNEDLSESTALLKTAQQNLADLKSRVSLLDSEKLQLRDQLEKLMTVNKELATTRSQMLIQLKQADRKYTALMADKGQKKNYEERHQKAIEKDMTSDVGTNETEKENNSNETESNNHPGGDWPISGKLMIEKSNLERENNSSIYAQNLTSIISSRFQVHKQITPSSNALEDRFLAAAMEMSKNDSNSVDLRPGVNNRSISSNMQPIPAQQLPPNIFNSAPSLDRVHNLTNLTNNFRHRAFNPSKKVDAPKSDEDDNYNNKETPKKRDEFLLENKKSRDKANEDYANKDNDAEDNSLDKR